MKHGWNLKLWPRVVDVWDPMKSFSAGWLAISTATVGGCDRFQWCGAFSRARPQGFTEDFDIWDRCIETYWNTVASILLPFVANRCQQHWLMDTTHAFVKSPFYWVGLLLFAMPFFFWYPLRQFVLGVEIRPLSTLPDVPIYDFVGEPLLCWS